MAALQRIFDQAVASALAGATVVTGNERAARALRHRCEQLLEPGRAHPTPQVLTFSVWIGELWKRAVISGADNRVLLSHSQARIVWERVIERSGTQLANPAPVAAHASEAWELAHSYGVPLAAPEFRLRPDSQAFAGWAAQYARECERNRWLDPALLDASLTDHVGKLTSALPKQVVFYGFDRLAPAQQKFLAALRHAGVDVRVSEHAAGDWSTARRLIADDSVAEFDLAARWARRRVELDPAARIGIIVPGLSSSRDAIIDAFSRVLHPEALLVTSTDRRRAFEVSLGDPLERVPPVSVALVLLKALEGELSLHDANLLLLSPYVRGATEERGPRAAADLELRRTRRASFPFGDFVRVALGARCPVFADAMQQASRVAASSARLSYSGWSERSLAVFKAAGWPGISPDSVEFQAVEAFHGLLEAVAGLDLVLPEPVSSARFLSRLRSMAADRTFSPENLGAPVQVLGHLEAAGSPFDSIWMCGLTDTQWPPRGRPNPLIPLVLQRRHGLPNANVQDDAEFAAGVLSRVLGSAQATVLSCPARDADGDVRATTAIALATTVPTEQLDLANVPSREQLLLPACESFQDELAPTPQGKELKVRTAVMEWQSNCPFRAFAQYRLRAEGLEEPATGIDARDRGKLVDAVLANIWAKLRTKFGLEQPAEPLARIIEGAVDAAMRNPDVLRPPATEWERRFYELERERMIDLANEWLDAERRRAEDFTVVNHQINVEVQLGDVTVNGRMDRLDQLSTDNFVVIDYKSGSQNNTPAAWAGSRPLHPQLPIYALSKPGRLDGVAFARVKRGDCKWSGATARPTVLGLRGGDGARDVNADAKRWRESLTVIAAEYAQGMAAVTPGGGEHTCTKTYCGIQDLCRYREIVESLATDDEVRDE